MQISVNLQGSFYRISSFNSLFEIQVIRWIVDALLAATTFNSLFEMRRGLIYGFAGEFGAFQFSI